MRDQLLGYLLDAIEPAEQEHVEQQLASNPELRNQLELLHRSLDPLRADIGEFQPPRGLATRTVQFVSARSVTLATPEVSVSRWSFSDVSIMAGIMLIASALFFPAL